MVLVMFGVSNGLFLTVTKPPAADFQLCFTAQDHTSSLGTMQEGAMVCKDLLNLACLMGDRWCSLAGAHVWL